jgi:DUF4097 and DUF4098 domain-containing protein YvlB
MFKDSLGDDIRKSVHMATEGIHDSVEAAMEDVKAAMKDLRLTEIDSDDMEFGFGETDESITGDVVEQQFEVDGTPSLSVISITGEITITTGEASIIQIRASKHGSRRRMENTYVHITREGNRITAETRSGKGGVWNLGKNVCRVDYDVLVPRGCRVHAKTVSADVRVTGTAGPFEIETVSGDVSVDDVRGESTLTTVSGDATIRRMTGQLAGRTTSGDFTVQDSELWRFNLNSVSGDFRLHTPLTPNEHYHARTVSGDLLLAVPPDTGATVQLKTVSGDVQSDLPAEIIRAGRRHWQGRINGGGANVEMTSVSGDLHIARGSESPGGQPARQNFEPRPTTDWQPQAPTPPEPPSPPQESETTRILRDLEVGEISVEEALARLEALR